MDLNGKNDPYVKLRLGTQTQETRVIMKTNDPVWEQRFVFGVSSVESEQLHLSVCDYDKFKQDDHIGTCHVGLSHLPCSEAVVCGGPNGHPDGDAAAGLIAASHMVTHGDGTSGSSDGGGVSDGALEGRAGTEPESVSSLSSERTGALSEDWGVGGARGSRRLLRGSAASDVDIGSEDVGASRRLGSKRCTPPCVVDVVSWVKKVLSRDAKGAG